MTAGEAKGARACAACWASLWAAHVRWEDGKGGVGKPVGLASWRGLSRPSLLWVCFPSLSFFVLFSSPLFDFKFGLKFEFQIGAPYSLKF